MNRSAPRIRGTGPAGGNISWENIKEKTCFDRTYVYQEMKWWAYVSARLYEPYRVVCEGAVVYESPNRSEWLDWSPQGVELGHGDIVSRTTSMPPGARHYAIYDKEKGNFIEYQPADGSTTNAIMSRGVVTATPSQDFLAASKGKDLRIDDLGQKYDHEQAIERARRCIGEEQYHPIFNNCEGFVRRVALGDPTSRQPWARIADFGHRILEVACIPAGFAAVLRALIIDSRKGLVLGLASFAAGLLLGMARRDKAPGTIGLKGVLRSIGLKDFAPQSEAHMWAVDDLTAQIKTTHHHSLLDLLFFS